MIVRKAPWKNFSKSSGDEYEEEELKLARLKFFSDVAN
jgi:hypothetical protein